MAAFVLAIAGPTASGKSALAHAVALAIGGEIVVADPFQRYRGLEIASDAPRARERTEVPYHLVGDLDLSEASRAGEFAVLAHAAIDDILARGRTPIVTGGTGLYLRAALCELDFSDPVAPDVRQGAEDLVARDPDGAFARLAALDPAAAARVDAKNPRRVARALELAETGRPAARAADVLWATGARRPTAVVGIDRRRDVLHDGIAQRVRRELDEGLVGEIESALDRSEGMSREAAQIIGVKEVLAMRRGDLRPDALAEALAVRTRRLARKQVTWLRKTPGVVWVEPGEAADAEVVRLFIASRD